MFPPICAHLEALIQSGYLSQIGYNQHEKGCPHENFVPRVIFVIIDGAFIHLDHERSDDIVNKKSFSVKDPKTKEVEVFLKGLQFERSVQRQKYFDNLEEQKKKVKRK